MRTVYLVLALALMLSACSSDSGTEPTPEPTPLSVRDWRVVSVSGDQAIPAPSATALPNILVSASLIDGSGYAVEPLVARIELTSEAQGRGLTLASLPAGTLVHWHITDGGGTLYGATTSPDDSAHILNRWRPSTRAADYTISAGRLVEGEIVTDATWTVTVAAGPAAQISVPDRHAIWLGDTLDLAGVASVTDAHGNRLPAPTWQGVDSTLLYTPTVEGYDTLVVSSGSISRAVEVIAMQLPGPGWTYSLSCRGITSAPFYNDLPQDSVHAAFVVDSVTVQPFNNAPTWGVATIVVHWTGEARAWHVGYDAGRRVQWHNPPWFDVRPGAVWPGMGYDSGPLTTTEGTPTQYVGEGAFCGEAAEIIETFTAPD